MRHTFPLFQSHLDLAHHYWTRIVQKGAVVIDATCGHGKDTLRLCQLALSNNLGRVYAFDVQEEAILSTQKYLQLHLPDTYLERLCLQQRSHATFPAQILPESVCLIVYNLGYLPGSNKSYTTVVDSTLQSVQNALPLIKIGGLICITCYPGHNAGKEEQAALLKFTTTLCPKTWNCTHQTFINRQAAPSLLLLQKNTNH